MLGFSPRGLRLAGIAHTITRQLPVSCATSSWTYLSWAKGYVVLASVGRETYWMKPRQDRYLPSVGATRYWIDDLHVYHLTNHIRRVRGCLVFWD